MLSSFVDLFFIADTMRLQKKLRCVVLFCILNFFIIFVWLHLSRAQDRGSPGRVTKPTIRYNPLNATAVIILAYMHTGSTFLGSIFQKFAYYEYESLRSLTFDTRAGMEVVYMNGSVRHPKGNFPDVSLAADAISKIVTCHHESLDIATLSRHYFSLKSQQMRDTAAYYRCVGTRRWYDKARWPTRSHGLHEQERIMAPITTNKSHNDSSLLLMRPVIQKCIPLLTDHCKNSTVRSAKFIRMRMEVVKSLLEIYPSIKIIHLTRDPRAMMDSQLRKNDMGTTDFETFLNRTSLMCETMHRDIILSKHLKDKYPGSIYSLQLEQFIKSPIENTKKMFQSFGLWFTESVKKSVESRTSDSKSKPEKWRSHIPEKHLKVVDKYCSKVYNELGYIYYPNIVDVRNGSKPTFT